MLEVLTPNHLACVVTMAVRSPDVSQNSRQSEVPTQVGSPDTLTLAGQLTAPVGSPDVRRES